MKNFIVADYSNFGNYGGVEKNAELITKDIEKSLNLKIKKTSSKFELFILFLKSLLKIKLVNYFICYKNSSITGFLFKLSGSKLIIRINNSPESYLYWGKLTSLLSHIFKIKLVKSEIILFNSKRIKNYYKLFSNGNKNLYVLSNNYFFNRVEIKLKKKNKIYLASRLSWEKNLINSYTTLQSVSKKIDYQILAYSSTINSHKEIKNFKNIEYYFNDIYVSLSFFEGMPNMVFHALFKGSALLLSNCWSHVEIYSLLSNFGLENRILIISPEYERKECLISEIQKLKEKIKYDELEKEEKKLSKLHRYLNENYKTTIEKICKLII